jgi:CubicO group peptidase (beta-lactamase class C family)
MVDGTPESVGLSSAKLREVFEAYKRRALDGLLPGGVMSIGRRGKTVFEEAFGVGDIASQAPLQVDSIFNIASMTKSVTSLAAGILFERGVLALDDPVSKYLPEFGVENLQVASSSDGTEPCKNPITIRMAMNHTTGYSYSFLFGRPEGDPILQTDSIALKLNTPAQFAKVPLAFQPGTRFRYGPSTQILGWVVEKASGMPLDEFFKKEIFLKLGMDDTFFTVPEEKRSRVATTYLDASLKGIAEMGEIRSMRDNLSNLTKLGGFGEGSKKQGDGGLYSTAADWQCFMRMLVSRGEGLITTATWTTLTQASTPTLDALDVIDAIAKRRSLEEIQAVRRGLFCTHYADRAGGELSGVDSGGTQLFANMANGGIAHNLIGAVATQGGAGNQLGVSKGAFGWEGIFSTKYEVDPAEGGLTMCFMSAVAPCWRFNLKLELIPGIYQAVIAPEHEHPLPQVLAVAPWTDDALSYGFRQALSRL